MPPYGKNPQNNPRSRPKQKTKPFKPKPKGKGIARAHHQSGMSAEEQVARIFPNWERVENKPGHDFIVRLFHKKRYVGRRYVEVKSTFSKEQNGNELTIVLKVYGNKWMNEIADDVLVLTRTHLYFGHANALREFVSRHHHAFRRIPAQDHHERIAVPLNQLVEEGIIMGVDRKKMDRKIAQKAYYEYCAPKMPPGEKRPLVSMAERAKQVVRRAFPKIQRPIVSLPKNGKPIRQPKKKKS